MENETLKDRLQHQQVLLNMTNAVTAAASQADGAPVTVQNNINSNNNITNNFIINVNGLSTVNPVGSESLAHLSGQDIEHKLRLIPGPQVFADWCAILRGDEGNPHNHNVLCLNSDSKEMAVCRKDGWIVDDKSVVMKEILGSDASRLYSAIGSRQEGSSQAQSFKYEYLLHQIMASICNDCNDPSLKPIFEAMAKPIIELTQKFYVEAVPDHKPPALYMVAMSAATILLAPVNHPKTPQAPVIPADCRNAKRLPETTPTPLASAMLDCHAAAALPAMIPSAPKPKKASGPIMFTSAYGHRKEVI